MKINILKINNIIIIYTKFLNVYFNKKMYLFK